MLTACTRDGNYGLYPTLKQVSTSLLYNCMNMYVYSFTVLYLAACNLLLRSQDLTVWLFSVDVDSVMLFISNG